MSKKKKYILFENPRSIGGPASFKVDLKKLSEHGYSILYQITDFIAIFLLCS